MTSQEQKTAQSVDRDIPDTEVIPVSAPSPVFVDSTGRRRRLLRRLAYAFGGLCVAYGGLISVSLAGGPVSSSAILPLPDLEAGVPADARPSPTPPPPTAAPKARAIIEALPRRELTVAGNDRLSASRPTTRSAAPAAAAKPARTVRPSATAKPVESATTSTPSASPSTSGSPSPSSGPTTEPTRQSVAPAPPGGTGGSTSGGTGSTSGGTGGSTSGDSGSYPSGGASALPAPPTEAPAAHGADATPAPSPQPPADVEVSE